MRHTTHNPRHGLGSRLVWRNISMVETNPMEDSDRVESGVRTGWQAHAFLLKHRKSCTVFRAIVAFAMTTMARSFTTHLTSLVVHRVRIELDSRKSGPSTARPRTHLTSLLKQGSSAVQATYHYNLTTSLARKNVYLQK